MLQFVNFQKVDKFCGLTGLGMQPTKERWRSCAVVVVPTNHHPAVVVVLTNHKNSIALELMQDSIAPWSDFCANNQAFDSSRPEIDGAIGHR